MGVREVYDKEEFSTGLYTEWHYLQLCFYLAFRACICSALKDDRGGCRASRRARRYQHGFGDIIFGAMETIAVGF